MATSLVGDGTPEAYFREGVKANVREDGRENSEFRKVVVEQGVVDHASGSAQVALGRTKVLATATLEIGSPREGRPSAGVVNVTVDCAMAFAVAGTNWRQYDKHGQDLARHIERLYNGSAGSSGGALDKDNALSIAEGQSVWWFRLDCVVLSDDGSLLDALALACRASLCDLRMPKFEVLESNEVGPSGPDITIDEDPNHFWKLNCSSIPTYVSIGVVGSHWVFDLTKREEAACGGALTFGVTGDGAITQVVTIGGVTSVAYASNMANFIEAACLAGKKVLAAIDSVQKDDDRLYSVL